ncbi:MAG: hypothetical protein E7601_03465 [Ruminococcaceae bacterium]|nr:hypothetical protein [Oscillospiraceae bacterium]
MKDNKTLAYINMFAILGSLPKLCEYDKRAARLVSLRESVSIAFEVNGGPSATFTFGNGTCFVLGGSHECDIKLYFNSCEHFNAMIDGNAMPVPLKGFTKIGFLTKNFTKLTDILSAYLRPEPEALKDEKFFNISTSLMLYVIGGAVAQIGNNDKIGRFSASNIVDGTVCLSIKDGPAVYVAVNNHVMTAHLEKNAEPRAVMQFADMHTARDLFDGNVNAMDCIGKQKITLCGMISMLDNVNRILDRVAVYLA